MISKKNQLLLALFAVAGLVAMIFYTTQASLHQNLFTQWSEIANGPWFYVTLLDFYINQIILCFWVYCLERCFLRKLFWTALFLCFGSMGTCLYILYRLMAKKPLLSRGAN